MIRETVFTLPFGAGIPALTAIDEEASSRGTVLVLHGLGAAKETQRPEIRRLARAGFRAVAIDAPCHGERREPFLDEVLEETGRGCRGKFRILLARAVAEIPELIAWFEREYRLPVGLTGISMGGHTTFCSLLCHPFPKVAVPIIGSPEYPAAVEGQQTPESDPAALPLVPLLVVTAGEDTIVPPARARMFVESMRPRYAAFPDRLRSLEFPASGHMMREEDWKRAWEEITAWFVRYLPVEPGL